MDDLVHIVKRKGHKEPYDNHKVYASCYAASLNAHISKERAEEICAVITREIDAWVADRGQVTSEQIFVETARIMEKQNADAAFMYRSHRDIS